MLGNVISDATGYPVCAGEINNRAQTGHNTSLSDWKRIRHAFYMKLYRSKPNAAGSNSARLKQYAIAVVIFELRNSLHQINPKKTLSRWTIHIYTHKFTKLPTLDNTLTIVNHNYYNVNYYNCQSQIHPPCQ